jgi:transcription antitermination factor NusA-like protein
MVAPDQLSLAIGKRGQNVRLSSKLTAGVSTSRRAAKKFL